MQAKAPLANTSNLLQKMYFMKSHARIQQFTSYVQFLESKTTSTLRNLVGVPYFHSEGTTPKSDG